MQGCAGSVRCWHGVSLLSKTEKAAWEATFFFFYPINSVYQIERISAPTIFEGIRV